MNCVFAKTIYTGKSIVHDRHLVFSDKNISGISKSAKGELLGHFDVVTPAFIDPHSHIGMERSGEPSGEGEANDHLDSILALTDVLDSVQMDDRAFNSRMPWNPGCCIHAWSREAATLLAGNRPLFATLQQTARRPSSAGPV